MEPTKSFFAIEQQGDLLVVTPSTDMGELDFERIIVEAKHALQVLQGSTAKNLIMDFHKTTYFGSTALGFFVRLWKSVCARKGRMAFCNLSEHEREILQITKLDTLWDICTSKEEALRTVNQ